MVNNRVRNAVRQELGDRYKVFIIRSSYLYSSFVVAVFVLAVLGFSSYLLGAKGTTDQLAEQGMLDKLRLIDTGARRAEELGALMDEFGVTIANGQVTCRALVVVGNTQSGDGNAPSVVLMADDDSAHIQLRKLNNNSLDLRVEDGRYYPRMYAHDGNRAADVMPDLPPQ